MLRIFARPVPLVLLLYVLTFIPIVTAMVRAVEIGTVGLPDDSAHLRAVPVDLFLHSISGAVFGILGPIQFMGALRRRFGRWHRMLGRVFAVAGMALGLSGVAIVFRVVPQSTPLIDVFRLCTGLALVISLAMAIAAARRGACAHHRAWMIRAYVLGMGPGIAALVMFPIYIVTGEAPYGLWSDIVFASSWAGAILAGEGMIQRISGGRMR